VGSNLLILTAVCPRQAAVVGTASTFRLACFEKRLPLVGTTLRSISGGDLRRGSEDLAIGYLPCTDNWRRRIVGLSIDLAGEALSVGLCIASCVYRASYFGSGIGACDAVSCRRWIGSSRRVREKEVLMSVNDSDRKAS